MKGLLVAALVLVAAGCTQSQPDRVAVTVQEPPCDTNTWLVEATANAEIRRGVIAQHTLYPYQFVTDGAALNSLGQRDLAFLAEHYAAFPGPLNVHRGEASEELYAQRIDTVVKALSSAGVDTHRIRIADAMPGGDGSPCDRVLLVMLRSQKEESMGSSSGTGTGTNTGGMADLLKGPQQ